METLPADRCEFCDGHVEQRTIRARFHYKGQTIYIDAAPCWVCTRCGEQYFDAPVYKHMEEIARHSDRITRTVAFPLAEYDKAPVLPWTVCLRRTYGCQYQWSSHSPRFDSAVPALSRWCSLGRAGGRLGESQHRAGGSAGIYSLHH